MQISNELGRELLASEAALMSDMSREVYSITTAVCEGGELDSHSVKQLSDCTDVIVRNMRHIAEMFNAMASEEVTKAETRGEEKMEKPEKDKVKKQPKKATTDEVLDSNGNPIDLKRVRVLYNKAYTISEVAEEMSLPWDDVQRAFDHIMHKFRDNGKKAGKRGGRRGIDREKVLSLHSEGKTDAQIADALRCKTVTITRILRELRAKAGEKGC